MDNATKQTVAAYWAEFEEKLKEVGCDAGVILISKHDEDTEYWTNGFGNAYIQEGLCRQMLKNFDLENNSPMLMQEDNEDD